MNITFDPTNLADQKVVLAFLKLCGQPAEPELPAGRRQTTLNEAIAPVTEEPKKRTRRTKEQIAADEAAAKIKDNTSIYAVEEVVDVAKAETEVIEKPAEQVKSIGEHLADAQAKPTPTKEEVIAKFQALVAKFGKEVATEKARVIINSLGAANVSGIPEDKRLLAVAAVDAELAG